MADGGARRMKERDPRRVAHHEHLGLVEEREAPRQIEERLGGVEQAIDLGVGVEGVVVGVAAPAVQQHGQEVRRIRKVGLPAEQEDRDDAGMTDRLDQRREIDGLEDRKSTRLNSSHDQISYAVFCLKKKKEI